MGVVGIAVAGAEEAGVAEALAEERDVGGSDDPRSIFSTGASSGSSGTVKVGQGGHFTLQHRGEALKSWLPFNI